MATIISKGNKKMGKIPNISLTPIVSCKDCVDICGKYCYAMKSYRMYPSVRKAWDANYRLATSDLAEFFNQVEKQIQQTSKNFFRWHVGGDIISVQYLTGMMMLAQVFPATKFLCFTKQYGIVNAVRSVTTIEPNLQLVFSAWPGVQLVNPHNFPVAWMQDGTEDRVPATAIECPGLCEDCGMCFELSTIGRDVVFHKH